MTGNEILLNKFVQRAHFESFLVPQTYTSIPEIMKQVLDITSCKICKEYILIPII